MMKKVFLFSLGPVLLVLSLLALMGTETGSRWLLQRVFESLPAQVSAQSIHGDLLSAIELSELHYQSATETIGINRLAFTWRPLQLFRGRLKIIELALNETDVTIIGSAPPPESSPFDWNAGLSLPLQVDVEKLLVTALSFREGENVQYLQKLHATAFTDQGRVNIATLEVDFKPLALSSKGSIGLGKGFPLALSADWRVATEEYGVWRATTKIGGNMQLLKFENQLTAPFELALQGDLRDLPVKPAIRLHGDWRKLRWPLTGKTVQVNSRQGSFELAGALDDYLLTLNAQLSQPDLPKAQLAFQGQGSAEALTIKKLALNSSAGAFQLGGAVSWKDAVVFELNASGKNFNPAIVHPEFPGSLNFKVRLNGRQSGDLLELDAAIDKLSGKLRELPLSAAGKLALRGEQLKVDNVQVVSGRNSIAVNGALGQEQGALDVAIDTPALEAFWPGLGGSLKGNGHLQGLWKNPSVNFKAAGKGLRFAEHRAERFSLDIDYLANANKTSKALLSVNGVKTGDVQISKLLVDVAGALEQHSAKAEVNSTYGDLTMALTGRYKNQEWRGDFSGLDLNARDFGPWRLKNKLPLSVVQTPAGVDATLADGCWLQQAAALCVGGRYLANGDFQAQFDASDLPARLMQAYLPADMRIAGLIDAHADIRQHQGVLAGQYQLTAPPHTKISLVQASGVSELALGALSVSGKLQGAKVTSDIDLALMAKDYVRAQLQLDTGKSQALSGQIDASIENFSLVEPFAPQLTAIKGRLKADMALRGRLAKPELTGAITFKQGAIDMADSGFGLRAIDLQAVAEARGRGNSIRVQGSVNPVMLNEPDAPEQLQINALLNLNADLQQQGDRFSGHYRLDMPANARISVKTPDARSEVTLGVASLSGDIDGKQVNADLNLALAAQDYCRANLHLDLGPAQTLSGKMTASVVEFAAIKPFVPQLGDIKGRLNADLSVAGSLDKPLVHGTVGLQGGAAELSQLGLRLQDIRFQAQASESRAGHIELSGFAKSGQGNVHLKGFAELPDTAELTLQGADFEVVKIPEAQVTVSPDLKLAYANRQANISGKLKIPKALLQIKELPENAVTVSQDEVILGEPEKASKPASASNITANMVVELGNNVSFSGMGLETKLSGKLQINKNQDKLAMYGVVDMDTARYKSYGQDLTVRKGRFLFSGPVDKPWLDLEAIRVSKSKDVTAILSLSGPLETPQVQISSEPALPESEALAYLVTGGPLNQVSQSEGNMVASAALSYGAGQVSWIADKLGVDEFEVKQGKTLQDTLVAVGQYLTPDFYLGTKVGLFNKQAVLVLKHKLTNSINVETQTGTSQRVKLNYEFDTD